MPPALRIVTFNVLGCRGFPSEPGQPVVFADVSPGLCAALAERLRAWHADIVLLQEAPPEPFVRDIACRIGMDFAFFATPILPGGDWPFGFPGALLSRHPITDAVDLAAGLRGSRDPRFQRHWGVATITAQGRGIRVATTHLCADWPGHDGGLTRLAEVEAIVGGPPVDLFGADCNTRPGEAPWLRLREAAWRDGWIEAGGEGNGFTSDTRNRIQRIDYVWLAPRCRWRAARAAVLHDMEVRVDGSPMLLSDHHPVAVDLEWTDALDGRS